MSKTLRRAVFASSVSFPIRLHPSVQWLAAASLISGLTVAGTPQAADIEHSPGGKWVKGRVLVAPKAGLDSAEFDKILMSHGAKSQRKLNGIDIHVVEVPLNSHGKEDAVARALARNPHLKFAEVDEIIEPSLTTNDPSLVNEWHLPKIGAQTAWDKSRGVGITIAILDTGVYGAHPDLATNMVAGWNAYDNNSNTADVHGHGTAVAGTAAATGNNGIGVAGVAYSAKIMPMRISDLTGYATWSVASTALTWAADHGAKVANLSYTNVYKSSTMQTAAQYLRNKGGITVVCANNNAINENTANTPTMITVSATDQNDNLASFSSWGDMVDISAPGVSILTTTRSGGYGAWKGCSFATPVTAGTVGLMMAANPALAPSKIESLLFANATDRGAVGYDIYFGYGRVNAAASVLAAKNATAQDTQTPTAQITSPTGGIVKGIVPVSVNASDNVGVTKVELYAGGALVATDTASPYSFSWNSATRADGATTLVAKAYDAAGNRGTSPTVNVTVANTVDTTLPTVKITSPLNGSKVSGKVTINVSASDNVALSSVRLYVDNVLKATGNTSLSYIWNTNNVARGTHSIKAVAKDLAGNSRTTSISVTK